MLRHVPAVSIFEAAQKAAAQVFWCTRWGAHNVFSGTLNPTHSRGAHWCNLVNMVEPSVYGSDGALCQITLITCCYLLK